MLFNIVLTTVIAPLGFGIAIAVLSAVRPARRSLILALLVPVAALVVHMMLEGMPAVPPVSAKHKLPLILFVAALVLAGIAAFRVRPTALFTAAIALVGLGASGFWLGRNVMSANPQKLWIVLAITLFAAGALGLCNRRGKLDADRVGPALATSVFAVSLAAALNAAFGAFVGMAQINGALAAMTGGWLLINYIRTLRGADKAMELRGVAALAFSFVITIHLVMTVLFTPKTSATALVLAVLPIVVAGILIFRGIGFRALPPALRPVATGLVVAIPALVSIVVAASQFEG
jgi:hypothetical protein